MMIANSSKTYRRRLPLLIFATAVALMLAIAIRIHAEPGGGPAFVLRCANVSPGALVTNGGDANLLLVSQPTHGRLTAPNQIMIVGFIGCAAANGCFTNKDINGDGAFTAADIQAFIAVLLQLDFNPAHVEAADWNCDGVADGDDIAPFINSYL